jgi:hypothetical protein
MLWLGIHKMSDLYFARFGFGTGYAFSGVSVFIIISIIILVVVPESPRMLVGLSRCRPSLDPL